MYLIIGLRPQVDSELLWIAEQALCAPLPPDWKVYDDHLGRPYFFNTKTRTAQWEHPLDEDYRQLYKGMKSAVRDPVTYAGQLRLCGIVLHDGQLGVLAAVGK